MSTRPPVLSFLNSVWNVERRAVDLTFVGYWKTKQNRKKRKQKDLPPKPTTNKQTSSCICSSSFKPQHSRMVERADYAVMSRKCDIKWGKIARFLLHPLYSCFKISSPLKKKKNRKRTFAAWWIFQWRPGMLLWGAWSRHSSDQQSSSWNFNFRQAGRSLWWMCERDPECPAELGWAEEKKKGFYPPFGHREGGKSLLHVTCSEKFSDLAK